MNSFSAIQKACEYEIKRQIKAYETGEPIVQETRLWDEGKQLTKSMRSKEGQRLPLLPRSRPGAH